MGRVLPAMTAATVARAALDYIKVGRLQASLAQKEKNHQFQSGCAYRHAHLNGFGEPVHCVIGAWLDQHGLVDKVNPRTDAIGAANGLFEKGYIPFVGVGQRGQLDRLQHAHDLACGCDQISRKNYKNLKKVLERAARGETV